MQLALALCAEDVDTVDGGGQSGGPSTKGAGCRAAAQLEGDGESPAQAQAAPAVPREAVKQAVDAGRTVRVRLISAPPASDRADDESGSEVGATVAVHRSRNVRLVSSCTVGMSGTRACFLPGVDSVRSQAASVLDDAESKRNREKWGSCSRASGRLLRVGHHSARLSAAQQTLAATAARGPFDQAQTST